MPKTPHKENNYVSGLWALLKKCTYDHKIINTNLMSNIVNNSFDSCTLQHWTLIKPSLFVNLIVSQQAHYIIESNMQLCVQGFFLSPAFEICGFDDRAFNIARIRIKSSVFNRFPNAQPAPLQEDKNDRFAINLISFRIELKSSTDSAADWEW